MKKLVLIIGIVLCIAVMGSVFAIAVYPAQDKTGTVTADKYVYLTLENSEGHSGYTLEKGIPVIIPIVIGIKSTDNTWGSATLTVTPSATPVEADETPNSIEKVEITMWTDEACTKAVTGLETNDTTGVMTLTGIKAARTVYVRLVLDANATQAEVEATNGNLTFNLVRVA